MVLLEKHKNKIHHKYIDLSGSEHQWIPGCRACDNIQLREIILKYWGQKRKWFRLKFLLQIKCTE